MKTGPFSELGVGLLIFRKCLKKSSIGTVQSVLFLSLLIKRQYSFGSVDPAKFFYCGILVPPYVCCDGLFIIFTYSFKHISMILGF